MNPNTLLRTAALLLIFTALGGLVLGLLRSKMPRPPAWLAMAHGLLAAAGLTLMLYAGFTAGLPTLTWAGILVLLGGVGLGIYLNLAYQAKLLALPVQPILLHGLIGVVGLFLICLGAFGNPPPPLASTPPASVPTPAS